MSGKAPRNLLAALAALLVVSAAVAQSPVGTAFTYQGQLKSNGTPVTAPTARVVFRLWDAVTGGTQVASEYVAYPVQVTGGLLNVPVDFGAAPFNGQARWVEVGVDTTGGTSYIWLTPRQPLTPTPQAQFALSAGDLAWPIEAAYAGGPGVGSMLKLDYAGDGVAMDVRATAVDAYAIYASTTESDTTAVVGHVSGESSAGVAGYAAATGANAANTGGSFIANGGQGTGVYGAAQANSGKNYGVRARSYSPQGYGGYFEGRGYFSGNVGIGVEEPTQKLDVAGTVKATGLQLATAPVAGYVLTSDAAGVGTWQPVGAASCLWQTSGSNVYYTAGNVGIGWTNPTTRLYVEATTGSAVRGGNPNLGTTGYLGHGLGGVYGEGPTGVAGVASHASGSGVFGENTATTGNAYGVYGKSAGTLGRAVCGDATATTGSTTGVWGAARSPHGRGVYAESTASTGIPVGVDAYVACPTGYAITAFNEGEAGSAVAMRADTASPDGIAIWGMAGRDDATQTASGVRGETAGGGAGVYGKATHASATAYGVKGEATSANGYGGYFLGRGYFSGNVGIGTTSPQQALDVAGTIQASGFKLTASPTAGYVLTCDANGVGSWQPAAAESLWQQTGSNIYFTGGNVGIGSTSPAAPLDIAGGNWDLVGTEGDLRIGSSSYRLKFGVATSGGSAGLARIRAYGIAGTPKIALGAGSFDVLTVTSTNVGVGTLVPDSGAKLDVAGKIKGTTLQVTTGATAGHVLTSDASGNATWQAPTGGGGLTLPYSGTVSGGTAGFEVTNTGSGSGLRGVGGNKGVEGEGTYNGVSGFSATGNGLSGNSNSGVGVKAQSSGTGTDNPALRVSNINNNGIGIFSTCGSTDANAVFVNTGAGDIIKGFSGATGGDLVFRVENDGKTSVSVLQITGGSDLSEQFDIGAAGTDTQPGMVVCIDPETPGKLVVSTRAYDRTVAGIISGAGGVKPGMLMGQRDTVANGQQPVALTGRVYAWADATNGAIQPGDLLTTADVPGHLMKVTDAGRAQGAIIGKAMSRLESGRGLVLVLVSLQ